MKDWPPVSLGADPALVRVASSVVKAMVGCYPDSVLPALGAVLRDVCALCFLEGLLELPPPPLVLLTGGSGRRAGPIVAAAVRRTAPIIFAPAAPAAAATAGW